MSLQRGIPPPGRRPTASYRRKRQEEQQKQAEEQERLKAEKERKTNEEERRRKEEGERKRKEEEEERIRKAEEERKRKAEEERKKREEEERKRKEGEEERKSAAEAAARQRKQEDQPAAIRTRPRLAARRQRRVGVVSSYVPSADTPLARGMRPPMRRRGGVRAARVSPRTTVTTPSSAEAKSEEKPTDTDQPLPRKRVPSARQASSPLNTQDREALVAIREKAVAAAKGTTTTQAPPRTAESPEVVRRPPRPPRVARSVSAYVPSARGRGRGVGGQLLRGAGMYAPMRRGRGRGRGERGRGLGRGGRGMPLLPPKPSDMAQRAASPRRSTVSGGQSPRQPISPRSPRSFRPRTPRGADTTALATEESPQKLAPQQDADAPKLPSMPKPAEMSKRVAKRRSYRQAPGTSSPVAGPSPLSTTSATRTGRLPSRHPSVRNPKGWFELGAATSQEQKMQFSQQAVAQQSAKSSKGKMPLWKKRMGLGKKKQKEVDQSEIDRVKSSLVYVKDNKSKVRTKSLLDQLTKPYRNLMELIQAPDGIVVRALLRTVEATDVPSISRALAHCFEASGQAMRLINCLLDYELATARKAEDILQEKGIVSKTLSCYQTEVALGYLQHTLKPLIQSVCYSSGSWEIDIAKVTPTVAAENLINLSAGVQMFLSKILRSGDSYPLSCRFVCHQILNKVSRSYPEQAYSAVGSFFFSRFVCPAITNPESLGLDANITPVIRRSLILVSKTLQALGTGQAFAEDYMSALEPILIGNQDPIIEFFEALATPPEGDDDNSKEILSQVEPDFAHVQTITRHIRIRLSELSSELKYMQTSLSFQFPTELDYSSLLTTAVEALNNQ